MTLLVLAAFATGTLAQVTTPVPVTVIQQAPSTVNAAAQSQNANSNGAIMNMAMGGMMLGMCSAAKPPNPLMCMMGMMLMMQGMMNQQAARDSQKTATQTVAYGTVVPVVQPNPYLNATQINTNVQNGMRILSQSGYKISPEGVKLPNGSFVPASDLSSPQALAAAGFDSRSIAAANKMSLQAHEQAAHQIQKVEQEEQRRRELAGASSSP